MNSNKISQSSENWRSRVLP